MFIRGVFSDGHCPRQMSPLYQHVMETVYEYDKGGRRAARGGHMNRVGGEFLKTQIVRVFYMFFHVILTFPTINERQRCRFYIFLPLHVGVGRCP